MDQLIAFFLWIEHRLTNPVETVAKDTLYGSLMFFDANGFGHMSPGSNMVCPAKGDG
jgi:hypothetical protein